MEININNNALCRAAHNNNSRRRCRKILGRIGRIGPRERNDAHSVRSVSLSLAILTLAFGGALYSPSSYANPQPENGQEQEAMPRAAVVVDEEKGIIRFIISGAEAMRLDETGLHVRGKFSSGGTQTIYGPAGFDDHIAEGENAP